MADLATLAIVIDASQPKTAGQEVSASLNRIGTSATGATDRLADLQRQFTETRARADALAAANSTVSTSTRTAATQTALMSQQTVTLGRAALSTAGQVAGLNASTTRLISGFGAALGSGGVLLGITAGMTVLATAVDVMRERAIAADRPLQDLVARLQELNTKAQTSEYKAAIDLANITQAAIEAEAKVKGLREELERLQERGPADTGLIPGLVQGLRERLLGRSAAGAERESLEAQRARQALLNKLAEDQKRKDEEAAERAAREHERAMARLKALQAERERAARAELEADQRRLRSLNEIYTALLRNVPDLSGGQVGTPAQARRGAQLIGDIARRDLSGFTDVFAAIAPGLQRAEDAGKAYLNGLRRQADASARTREGVVNLADALGLLPDNLRRVADAALDTLKGLSARRLADPGGVAKLETGDFLNLAAAGVGLVQGILSARRQAELEAARFRAATADWERSLRRFADSIGGQSQLAQALQTLEDQFLGLAGQAAERNKILVGGDIGNYTSESIARRQAEIAATFRRGAGRGEIEDLIREARFLQDLARARDLERRAIEEAQRAFAEQEFAYRESLEARRLDALGRSAEAEALRLQERQRQELLEAQRTGYDAVTQAILAQVQALEAEEQARQQAVAALRRAQQEGEAGRDLIRRERALAGDDRGVAELDLASRAIAEFERVQELFREGIIGEDVLQRFQAVIADELNQGLADLAAQALAAAQAVADFNRVTQQDLRVRELAALGRSDAAEDLRRAIEQERELAALREQGATAETLALAAHIHELEALAAATRRLEAAEAQRLRQLEEERETQERLAQATEDRLRAERRLGQDLDVRFLQALGQDQAAEDLRRQVQNARELEEAISSGFSQTMIDFLKQVQEAERQSDLRQREERIVAALDPDAAARAERTTSFDGRSISGAQADTMAAYLATIAINSSQIVRLMGGQPQTITRGAVSPTGGPLGGASMQITIQPARGETPGQALDRVLASQGQLEATASGSPPAL